MADEMSLKEDDEFLGLIMEINDDKRHDQKTPDIKMEVDVSIGNVVYDSLDILPVKNNSDQQIDRCECIQPIFTSNTEEHCGMKEEVSHTKSEISSYVTNSDIISSESLQDQIKIESVIGSCHLIQSHDCADGDVNTVNYKEDTLTGKQERSDFVRPDEPLNVDEDQEINAVGDVEVGNSQNDVQFVDHEKQTNSEEVYQEHLNNKAEGINEKRTSSIKTQKRPHVCTECNKQFKWQYILKQHMLIHTKQFRCTECDYKSERKTLLRLHMRIHSGENPFQCHECDKKFSNKSNLKQHKMKHTGEKPFLCSECDYTFRHKCSLTRHILIHTGEKPFQCSECDYKCRDKSNLNRHMLIHTSEKPFQCSECDKKFSNKYNLKQHKMKHVGENQFQCSMCDVKFSHSCNLTRHMLIH